MGHKGKRYKKYIELDENKIQHQSLQVKRKEVVRGMFIPLNACIRDKEKISLQELSKRKDEYTQQAEGRK